jgi:hypothetical protein
MRNTIAIACGACVIAGLTATAQTPSYPTPAPTTQSAASAETSLTLVGCLNYWDGSVDKKARPNPSRTARQPVSGPSARYMLSNVESRNQSGGVPLASYALTGDSAVNLAGHVNHKVQVSGTIAADQYGNPSQRADASGTSLPTLKVTSMKMLESTCP